MRRRPLTARGVAALLLGLCCAVVANVLAVPLLLYLGVLLIALVVLAAIVVHAPRRSGTVTRSIATDLLPVGETSRVLVRLDIRSVLPPPVGAWEDALPAAVDGSAVGAFPPEGERGRRTTDGIPTTLVYDIRGVRRGLWALGPLTLTTVDPFGLVRRSQEFGESRPITVVPEVVAIPPLRDRIGAAGGTAQTSSSRIGQGSDNLTPRRYVPGDSMRRIHWRATAHRGDLMVRQEEQESSPDAIVVLDRAGDRWPRAGRGSGPGSGSGAASGAAAADPAFERAVSAVASIALHLSDHGYAVDVVDATGVLIGRLRGIEDDRDGLLIALAAVSPRRGERDEGLAAARGAHTVGPLVVVTGALTSADADTLTHGGAATPILLATDAAPGTLDAAVAHGWFTGDLDDDIAASWADAVPSPRAEGVRDARS
ncbi:uncharacterized protein (DUF58 family) [Microbacterium resistens]|uniref:Uncharacterized protein (DUF58 family) n=1 Tax=Microbacterium resistens TaxID=156977 RepID=A0ABU1SHA4_9MICO|nr:DUF58 domain-containing protein [Microbacterium resistens]MDR6868994.1 uncharacterized protein (DUF58 family) [Microbacterium resistens]